MRFIASIAALRIPILPITICLICSFCKAPAEVSSSVTSKGELDKCEEAKLIEKSLGTFAQSNSFQSAMEKLHEKMQVDPDREHSLSFGRDTSKNIILSSITLGSRSSGNVPGIANAFADLHNHPNNTPPSSGDLYGLLRNNAHNSRYTMRFVVTASDFLYALSVVDSVKARLFLRMYPPQQTTGYSPLFPDALLDEYREIHQRYGTPEEMAMAYMLEKYNAGVVLLKRLKSGAFKLIRTKLASNGGEKIFTAVECY